MRSASLFFFGGRCNFERKNRHLHKAYRIRQEWQCDLHVRCIVHFRPGPGLRRLQAEPGSRHNLAELEVAILVLCRVVQEPPSVELVFSGRSKRQLLGTVVLLSLIDANGEPECSTSSATMFRVNGEITISLALTALRSTILPSD